LYFLCLAIGLTWLDRFERYPANANAYPMTFQTRKA
jgi:hypothetical protein